MTWDDHAFLSVEVEGARPRLAADLSDATRPRWWSSEVEVIVEADPEADAIRQTWLIRERSGRVPTIHLRLAGRIDRPALAEITELDALPPTGAATVAGVHGSIARLRADRLPATAEVMVAGLPAHWRPTGDGLLGTLSGLVGGEEARFTIEVSLSTPPSSAEVGAGVEPIGDPLIDRALAYVRGCTALRVAADERAIITDHRILPLSWTRDAYWQALALLAADGPGDRGRVADHLRWLWRRCERPDERWVRSHHANGRRKDLAFQADQQLYPMIELADHWRLTGTLPAGVDWDSAVGRAWDAALAEIDPAIGLIRSAENAADDPAAAPYIGASQIVLWYAAMRIAEVVDSGALRMDARALRSRAAAVRSSFASHFGRGGAAWPYAIDPPHTRIAYHDANDIPVTLAPLWGFCGPDDEGWRATMAFAFSPANPAWCEGPRAGLGSAHTPGPWTLGDIQAWLRGRIDGDDGLAEGSLQRLEEIAFADHMLPEAYATRGDERHRHWFAWPGAAQAAFRLLDRAGNLQVRLSAI